MPWCDECATFWGPPTVATGRCPACGAADAAGDETGVGAGDESRVEEADVERGHAPWHFKLLVVAMVLYLGFRAYQGVLWIAHHV